MYQINQTMSVPPYLDSYKQPNKYIMHELNQVLLILTRHSLARFLQATKPYHKVFS
jgi:hypothetical protein